MNGPDWTDSPDHDLWTAGRLHDEAPPWSITDEGNASLNAEPHEPIELPGDPDQPDVVDRLGARGLSDVPTDPPPTLLIDRLDPLGHTILYGTGGSCKGTLASWWIVQLVRVGHHVLIVDYENHPEEWARRVNGLGGAEALAGVTHVSPRAASWQGRSGPIWSQQADLRDLAIQLGIDYLVIDSIVPACGASDALKPEAASQYAGALEFIGLPALSLAHVTKAEDAAYPFGSVFWHNLSRMTFSLARKGERIEVVNRKHNNYPKQARSVVVVTWDQSGIPSAVWEGGSSIALAERIDEALGSDSLTCAEIVDRLNEDHDEDEPGVKPNSVQQALIRGLKSSIRRYSSTGKGSETKWSRVA